jgi:hypothetical protein
MTNWQSTSSLFQSRGKFHPEWLCLMLFRAPNVEFGSWAASTW